MKDNKYNKESLEIAVLGSLCVADICRKLGLRTNGNNHKTIKKYLSLYKIDTSHFLGSKLGTLKLNEFKSKTKICLEDRLVEKSEYPTTKLKTRLIKEGILENKCNNCGNLGNWLNKPLVLQLEHKNGDHHDHRLENLELLCPNCHSQTDTWGNKRR